MPRAKSLTSPRTTVEPAPETPRAAPRRVVVFVHGAGNFEPGYDNPWADELAQRLGGPIAHMGAWYGNVLNRHTPETALAFASDAGEQARFKNAFREQLRRAYDGIPPMQRTPRITSYATTDIAAAFHSLTEQVAVYLFNKLIADRVQACIMDSLGQAMSNFDEIVLVSHSLGSVIAFDVLREAGDRFNKISTWFTLGCPLAKFRRVGMRGDDLGLIARQNVGRWYNLYDTTDIVADVLGSSFPRPGYRIHDIFVQVARDPIASHDYLHNAETFDLIADALR